MRIISLFLCLSISSLLIGQPNFYKKNNFTLADTLRGSLRPERTCYDVHFYNLHIKVNINQEFISGYNDIYFTAIEDFRRLQIDLYQNMEVEKIVLNGEALNYERQFNAIFVDFPLQKKGTQSKFRVYYRGQPRVARQPPWDGGFVWAKDKNNQPWVGVACEGAGASLWWPNKDHLSDEPDSMSIQVAVPDGLTCVANGNLRNTLKLNDGYTRFDWFVSYPINNYNVSINIANYAHFSDSYAAGDGSKLALDYYVLPDQLQTAKKHFQQVHKTLACFERYFGKYPFWKDGFALVETPYLGMEHQSAIAYGNHYQRGYLGSMIPSHMNWDYIIVHETGHEYWGNSISSNDHAEMWIHESFTTYMESLFVECAYNYKEAVNYLVSQRPFIYNREPILGPLDVNWDNWVGSDHYFKGSWMLHTLRHAIHNDGMWFDLLRSFYDKHAISNINTQDFINYVNSCTKRDWSSFFEQYLRYPGIPTLLYKMEKNGKDLLISYKWKADVAGFNMPVLVGKENDYILITPNTSELQQTLIKNTSAKDFKVATELFLVKTKELN